MEAVLPPPEKLYYTTSYPGDKFVGRLGIAKTDSLSGKAGFSADWLNVCASAKKTLTSHFSYVILLL